MQSLKLFFIALGFLINSQTILSMNSTDYNQSKKIADYITIELANNQQAQMLPEEFARLCEQSVTVQNDITYLVGKDSILNAEGKLTVNYSQFPEHYSLSMLDEDTFAELLSYIVYGKISESIQDDCLCKLINVGNYLDMQQLLQESTTLFAQRTTSAEILSLLLSENNFNNYYQSCAIVDDIQKKEIVLKITQTELWKRSILQIPPKKMCEFTLDSSNDFFPAVAIGGEKFKFIVTNSNNGSVQFWSKNGRLLDSFNTGSPIKNIKVVRDRIITLHGRGLIKTWDFHGNCLNQIANSHQSQIIDRNGKYFIDDDYGNAEKMTLCDIVSGDPIQQFNHLKNRKRVSRCAVNAAGTLLLTQHLYDNKVYLWNILSGKLIYTIDNKPKYWFKPTSDYITDINFNPVNDNCIITNYESISVWDSLSGKMLYQIFDNNSFSSNTICGKEIMANYYGVTLKIVSALTKSILYAAKDAITTLAISSDDTFLVGADLNGKVQLWDLVHADLLQDLSLKQAHVAILILSKKVLLNNLPNHLQEVYETLPQAVKTALNSIK